MASIWDAVTRSGGPVDLPLDVVAWWLDAQAVGRISRREAVDILRSLIRKGYINGELGWDTVYTIMPCGQRQKDHAAIRDRDRIMSNKDIFIVHGHDAHLREAVARFIEQLGFNAIILSERPSGGRTLIEQVERYSDALYAVVLLTPDDIIDDEGRSERTAQARQNVIFELGFFVGRLGRSRVHCIRKGSIQLFSDFDGVVWTPADDPGVDWRVKLAREMSAAGLSVDMNKVFTR